MESGCRKREKCTIWMKNGQRIKLPSGNWKTHKEDTTDWNRKEKAELWRHAWEETQNRHLELAGSDARIDMRSYERQGSEKTSQIHLGTKLSYLEKQGVKTEIGNINREVAVSNRLLDAIIKKIKAIEDWMKDFMQALTAEKVIESPNEFALAQVLISYMDLRKAGRSDWTSQYAKNKWGANDLQEVSHTISLTQELGIHTVNDLGVLLNQQRQREKDLRNDLRSKQQRVRNIDSIFQIG